ncbi:2-hydroxyacid dehydrogenase [Inquilinus sp. NPDC058860]|uniref:2-hydroxyacid dehydrogenase n=1 Tax=Inquilinus sp. NPDC058860 TaxID=3346652 RepID=UPI0036805363
MTFLYKSEPARGEHWKSVFAIREPDLAFHIWPEVGDPAKVRYMAAWLPPDDMATGYPNLEVLFSVGAGVDQLNLDAVPPHVKVVRMLDPGVPDMMAEFVVTAAMTLHGGLLAHRHRQDLGAWEPLPFRPVASRRVGVLGLGRLGSVACARLAAIGFQVAGWSRSRHAIAGVEAFSGADQLDAFLARTEILVCLLPLTGETRGILGSDLFRRLPDGAMVVNAGRGGHLDQEALLVALDSGRLAGAVLDVTDPEPLPADHPMRRHPRILITPHIAATAQPETSVEVVLENLRRLRTGEELLGLVDRRLGY